MSETVFQSSMALTLGDLTPASSEVVRIPLSEREDGTEFYLRSKRCRKAADRDVLLSTISSGAQVTQTTSGVDHILRDTVAGRLGPIAFLRACWALFVTEYAIPGTGGSVIRGNAQDPRLDEKTKVEAFETLVGTSDATVNYLVDAFMRIHRIGRHDEERVVEELGNSGDGAEPPPAE